MIWMGISDTRRGFLASALLGTFFLSGCNFMSEVGGNLALTNSSGESKAVTVRIADRSSGESILRDLYQVPASDDGILVADVVTQPGSYDVEATTDDGAEAASGIWRLNDGYYSIRVGVLSDGSLRISGDGI